MKKILLGLCCAIVLCGCAAEETVETVADDWASPVNAQQRQTYVKLPEEAASPAVESGSDRLYQCEDYEITLQTLSGGDLKATVQGICGYDPEDLTVMHRQRDGVDSYEFVWTTMGEEGECVGRAKILDDGSYHYVLTVFADADKSHGCLGDWLYMFESFTLT